MPHCLWFNFIAENWLILSWKKKVEENCYSLWKCICVVEREKYIFGALCVSPTIYTNTLINLPFLNYYWVSFTRPFTPHNFPHFGAHREKRKNRNLLLSHVFNRVKIVFVPRMIKNVCMWRYGNIFKLSLVT